MRSNARSGAPEMEVFDGEWRSERTREIESTLWHLLNWRGSMLVSTLVAKSLSESDIDNAALSSVAAALDAELDRVIEERRGKAHGSV